MTPTKLLVGQILIVFVIVIAGVSSATQWAAFQLGYQGQLGATWTVLFGIPVYYPWRLFEWSENERSGVLSTAMSFLGLYRDPTVATTTAACDWRIADLVDATRPVQGTGRGDDLLPNF